MPNVITIEDLSLDHIHTILDRGETHLKALLKGEQSKKTISGRTLVNVFFENSTRTSTSLELACHRLGGSVVNLKVGDSSMKKGETLLDTAVTFDAMLPDAIAIRHTDSGAVHLMAERISCAVINNGDGSHAHPTQALLDALSIRHACGRIEGLKVAICGDILHSRVVRSNVELLTKMGAEVRMVGPTTLLPKNPKAFFGAEAFDVLEDGIAGCDVVMMLRVQNERMHGHFIGSTSDFFHRFGLTRAKLSYAKPNVKVMHPGPMNRGVEIDSDIADDVQHSIILDQVKCGVAVRQAVLEYVLGVL